MTTPAPNEPPTRQAPSGAVVVPETEQQPQPRQPGQPPNPSQQPSPSPATQSTTTQRNGPTRRKFTKDLDLALLKEVQAAGAHRAPHGQTLLLFEQVAQHFNASGLVAWKTDGKHCQDRFKLLIAKFRKEDKEKAAASGGAEEYGEYEQLCQDLATEIDDFKNEKEAAKTEAAEKEAKLVAAGEHVRDMAMVRASKRKSPEPDGEEVSTLKKQKTTHSQAATDMSRAISAVEKAEVERLNLLVRQEERDEKRITFEEKRIELEEHRIETEAVAAEHRNEIEKRRVDLEGKRFEEEKKRSEEAATERRMGLEVQRSMLELIREMRSKKD